MVLEVVLQKNIKPTFLYIIDMIVHCDTTVQLLLITSEYRLYKSFHLNLGIN